MTHNLLIRNAHVLDVSAGSYEEADVAIADGQIMAVGQGVPAPEGARTIDARGQYLLPGLIDAHVHVTAVIVDLGEVRFLPPTYVTAGAVHILEGMLDRGFTTVRDTGGADFGLARAQMEGLVRGPRIVFGGKSMSQTGGHGDRRPRGSTEYDSHPCCAGTSRIVDGVEGVRLAAREELRRGASHLKMHVSGGVTSPTDAVDEVQYSTEEIRAAVEVAENAGAYVTVHAYPPKAITRALDAGVRCVEHGNLVDEASLDALKRHDAFLVPTVATYWALHRFGLEHGLPQDNWNKVSRVLDVATQALEAAARKGIRIVFGTDMIGPMHQYQSEEFRIRAEVQKPLEIIRSATIEAAALLCRDDLGAIRPNAVGDVLLLDADPLEDVTLLAAPNEHIRAVVQGGRLVVDRLP